MAVNVINNIKQQVIVDFDKYLNRLYIGHQDNYDNILHKIAFIQTASYIEKVGPIYEYLITH